MIEKILTHLGLDPQPPPRGRARGAARLKPPEPRRPSRTPYITRAAQPGASGRWRCARVRTGWRKTQGQPEIKAQRARGEPSGAGRIQTGNGPGASSKPSRQASAAHPGLIRAFGLSTNRLKFYRLLNYLEVDGGAPLHAERRVHEPADPVRLESRWPKSGSRGDGRATVREGEDRQAVGTIRALLAVEGFAYRGTVPKTIRYPRRRFKFARRTSAAEGAAPIAGRNGRSAPRTGGRTGCVSPRRKRW